MQANANLMLFKLRIQAQKPQPSPQSVASADLMYRPAAPRPVRLAPKEPATAVR